MALQPSRPSFMLAGALVFLALPFLWASFAQQAIDRRLVAGCVACALVFVALALQYRREWRRSAGVLVRDDG